MIYSWLGDKSRTLSISRAVLWVWRRRCSFFPLRPHVAGRTSRKILCRKMPLLSTSNLDCIVKIIDGIQIRVEDVRKTQQPGHRRCVHSRDFSERREIKGRIA